jgi:hypothetical protein
MHCGGGKDREFVKIPLAARLCKMDFGRVEFLYCPLIAGVSPSERTYPRELTTQPQSS